PAGTPMAMTDSSGNVVWRADYKPFGEEQSVTSTVPNDKRFIGKEKDEETGFSYFGARYENAKIGRFIAPDPERAVDPKTSKTNEDMLLNPQRLNTYAYSLNNPYRFVDPDGREAIPWSMWWSDASEIAAGGAASTVGTVVGVVGGIVLYPSPIAEEPDINAPVFKSSAGKNDPHSNQKAKDKARKDYEKAKDEYDKLDKKSNKTPDDKERLKKQEKRVDKLKKDADWKGETHHRK
ncbi:MAG: RHS domain-containing protein, partial [Desulfuromonadales bacterium]|nr:RHS domain-containing protein [Desulfuromonadales bacterium]